MPSSILHVVVTCRVIIIYTLRGGRTGSETGKNHFFFFALKKDFRITHTQALNIQPMHIYVCMSACACIGANDLARRDRVQG